MLKMYNDQATWWPLLSPPEDYANEAAFFGQVLREGNQPVQVEHDTHICGIFPRANWLRWMREVGFEPEIVHDDYERDIFVAGKPKS